MQHAIKGDYRLVLAPLVLAETRRKYGERFPAYASNFESFLSSVPYELAANPTAEDIRANLSLMRDPTDVPIGRQQSRQMWITLSVKTGILRIVTRQLPDYTVA